jgi:hypothetical protein
VYLFDLIAEQAEEKEKKRKLEEDRQTEIARKHAAHESKRKAVKLSFLDDESDEGNDDDDDWGGAVKKKLARVVKNDEVDTSVHLLHLVVDGTCPFTHHT